MPVPLVVGGRKHEAVARAVSERAITLIKDARNSVPLPTPRTGERAVSVGARLSVGLAHRGAEPHGDPGAARRDGRTPRRSRFRIARRRASSTWCARWPAKYDAVVAGVFVRASSGSGRLDLAPQVVQLLQDLSRAQRAAVAAVRGGVLRQPLHADVRAGDCRRCC